MSAALSSRPTWELALRSLNSLLCRASVQDARCVSDECEKAMRECIRHGKPLDALQAYGAVCSSGMYDLPSSLPQSSLANVISSQLGDCETQARPSSRSSATSLDFKSLDQLAVIALQMCPNRSLQSKAVAQLVAAEMDNDISFSNQYLTSIYQPGQPAPAPEANKYSRIHYSSGPLARSGSSEHSKHTSHLNGEGRSGSNGSSIGSTNTTRMSTAYVQHFTSPSARSTPVEPIFKIVNATQAELFRVQLRQNLFLLQSTGILQEALGRNYLLSQARQVVTDRRLRRVVEVESLVAIGRELLNHPLVFQKPSTAHGRRQLLFEDIGVFSRSDYLSAAQQEKIRSLEASVSPTRSVCANPLEFVHVLVQSWDDIFLERLMATYVSPSSAGNVMPHRQTLKQSKTSLKHGEGKTTTAKEYEEPRVGLFEARRGAKEWTVEARVRRILRARRFHDVVVPDCAFTLNNFPQLVQLARHREVILTHTTLLGLAEACSDSAGPRRFHARKVLSHFLNEARTALSSPPSPPNSISGFRTAHHESSRGERPESVSGSRVPWAGGVERRSPFRCGGVTILGLQDELAMLDSAEERTFIGDTATGDDKNACSAAADSDHHWRGVVLCKQLDRLLEAQDDEQRGFFGRSAVRSRGRSPTRTAPAAKTTSTGSDSLDHIISNLFLDEEDVVKPDNGKGKSVDDNEGAPILFSQRGQRSAAPRPSSAVVLATTTTDARQIAFSVGQRLFPPVSSA